MSAIWFDAGALGALKDDFTFSEAHLLDVLFGGVALRHCSRIREHRLKVAGDGEEDSAVEDEHVEIAVDWVGTRKNNNFHDLQ